MLILVLVLKDSLRTFSSPCPCPGPWGSGPCPCPGPCRSGPCPYPGPCGLVLVLVLVFSPCKDLFPLFHYSDLFPYYCIQCQCIQLVLITITYVFPAVILLCVYKYDVFKVLRCPSVIIIDIIRLIKSMVTIPRWSSILKVVMKV